MKKDLLWKLTYNRFSPEEEGLRESLCTLGNGYMGTRGAATEAIPSEMHCPGTYIAGLYNRTPTEIAGRTIYNEDMVNCPNWIHIVFRIGNGRWIRPSSAKILSYRQELDMQKGILTRNIRFQTSNGQKTSIEETRLVHMDNPHLAAIRYIITPENYNDIITLRTMLDGTVENLNVERYRELNTHHLTSHHAGRFAKNGIYLCAKTSHSKVDICVAEKLKIYIGDKKIQPVIELLKRHKNQTIGQEARVSLQKGQSLRIEKIVSIYTSGDEGIDSPKEAAIKTVKVASKFRMLLETHQKAWARLWEKFDIKVEGHKFAQKVLRLHMFHLLQTASTHNVKVDAGFPARGLHGEAYRGHVFWDEMFAMKFFSLNSPEVAKALLMYRYRRLSKAREYAKENGYNGAMFPWQSGSSGREETQEVHLNPMSGKWGPDYSCLQRHVSVAIAYNIWRHWRITGDLEFLVSYAAEIFLSIAQFFSSLVCFDEKDGRYHTERVMGPDEFHEKMPNSSEPGLRDNAYTNIMIVWVLLKAEEVLAFLPEKDKQRLMKKIKLTAEEMLRWEDISRKMNIIFDEKGIISQFDGYFQLKELDWNKYKKKYDNIHRMDRILKAEGKTPDAYKLSKQADVLMIFYLLRFSEVQKIFKRLGYSCDINKVRKNYDYYVKRTSHGSTLSKVVHCFVAQLMGREQEVWKWFLQVLESDINDTQSGTTPEGIHAGVLGGSIDVVIRGFAGIEMLDDRIKITPRVPRQLKRICFKICYRKRWIDIEVTKKELKIHIGGRRKVVNMMPVEINSKLHLLPEGRAVKFSI
ncbi:MAG: glycosyl hydrolase family 65 protein [Candidatus Omnitrophota bacterium]